MEKFIELGGGAEKGKFIIVPTAGGNRNQAGELNVYNEQNIIGGWLKRGLKNVKMLHTHDPKVANTEDFVKDLREATAVWFNGGRQWNIVDSYAGTLTYKEFHKVLERGGTDNVTVIVVKCHDATADADEERTFVPVMGLDRRNGR